VDDTRACVHEFTAAFVRQKRRGTGDGTA
jgi:hypothetical protein